VAQKVGGGSAPRFVGDNKLLQSRAQTLLLANRSYRLFIDAVWIAIAPEESPRDRAASL